MYTIVCKQCGADRILKNAPRLKDVNNVCKKCSIYNRKQEILARPTKVYSRTCTGCNETQILKFKPSSTICSKCSSKKITTNLIKRNTKQDFDKIKYMYICRHCGDVRNLLSRRLTSNCATCHRLYGKKKEPKIYYCLKEHI